MHWRAVGGKGGRRLQLSWEQVPGPLQLPSGLLQAHSWAPGPLSPYRQTPPHRQPAGLGTTPFPSPLLVHCTSAHQEGENQTSKDARTSCSSPRCAWEAGALGSRPLREPWGLGRVGRISSHRGGCPGKGVCRTPVCLPVCYKPRFLNGAFLPCSPPHWAALAVQPGLLPARPPRPPALCLLHPTPVLPEQGFTAPTALRPCCLESGFWCPVGLSPRQGIPCVPG